MKRVQTNFILNLISYFILILLASTGLLLEYVLIPGSRGGHGLALWGMCQPPG